MGLELDVGWLGEVADVAHGRYERMLALFEVSSTRRPVSAGLVMVILETALERGLVGLVADGDASPAAQHDGKGDEEGEGDTEGEGEEEGLVEADEEPARQVVAEAVAAEGSHRTADAEAKRTTQAVLTTRIVNLLRAMAVDGQMPSTERWDELRPPRLPKADGVMWRTGLTWRELAQAADLEMPGSKTPTLQEARLDPEKRRRLLEEFIFRLRDFAVGGILPSMKSWDEQRGELPTARELMELFGLVRWAEIEGYAKIKTPLVQARRGAR